MKVGSDSDVTPSWLSSQPKLSLVSSRLDAEEVALRVLVSIASSSSRESVSFLNQCFNLRQLLDVRDREWGRASGSEVAARSTSSNDIEPEDQCTKWRNRLLQIMDETATVTG